MQSFPVIASRWLHFRLSNVLARSTAGCSVLPWRYSSWMQHWVITKDQLRRWAWSNAGNLGSRGDRAHLVLRFLVTPSQAASESRVSGKWLLCTSPNQLKRRKSITFPDVTVFRVIHTKNLVWLPEPKRHWVQGHQFAVRFRPFLSHDGKRLLKIQYFVDNMRKVISAVNQYKSRVQIKRTLEREKMLVARLAD